MQTKASATKTCPVCGYEIDTKTKPIQVGRHVILVCCEECEKKVRADPKKYINGR